MKPLVKEPDTELRYALLSTLGALGPDAKELVAEMFVTCYDKESGRAVAAAAEKIGKPIVPDLIRALAHWNPWLRWAAVWALGNMAADAKAALPGLEEARKNDDNDEVRAEAARSIRRIQAALRK